MPPYFTLLGCFSPEASQRVIHSLSMSPFVGYLSPPRPNSDKAVSDNSRPCRLCPNSDSTTPPYFFLANHDPLRATALP